MCRSGGVVDYSMGRGVYGVNQSLRQHAPMARKLQALGHDVRLMEPQFVKPDVRSGKNDAADAKAIFEAVTRPTMRSVPIKNVEQQTVFSLHEVRQGFIRARSAQTNQIRGLLGEYGVVVP
jgi:transposase